MRNKVALFGGSFNPIGRHHMKIGQTIFEQLGMCTWYMPCFQHRFSKSLAEAKHRWNMLLKASEDFEWMVPCDWEIAHASQGSMIDTVTALCEEYPHIDFHIVIGMDCANIIEEQWDRGKLLISLCPFIVFTRPVQIPTTDWFKFPPHQLLHMATSQQSPKSDDWLAWEDSTSIRATIGQKGDYAKRRLHPKVWTYIQRERLYGYTDEVQA